MIAHPADIGEPILVTGADGLVGRSTVARLARRGRVYALVRKRPQYPLAGGAAAIEHDLSSTREPVLPEVPRTIVHLAQSPHHRDFPKGALDVFDVNVGSTQRLLDWGARHGVKRFVYASSGGVYGQGAVPFDEDTPLPGAGGHYLASKRCGELIADAYRGRMTIIVLRFFFVYGPGQREVMLIPRLVRNVIQGQPILLQGPDGLRINPIHAEDAAAAVEAACGLVKSEIINVAGPEVLSLREIGTAIGEATGHAPRFDVQPDVEPRNLIGDIRKMTELLGAPRIRFADGIVRLEAIDRAPAGQPHANR